MAVTSGRAEFADARLIECEELRTYHGSAADPDERVERNLGIGVRVLVDGAWGFASQPLSDPYDAERSRAGRSRWPRPGSGRALRRYCPTASRRPADMTPPSAKTFCRVRWGAGRAAGADGAGGCASAGVVGVQSGINAKRQHRHFGDTAGSRQHQHLVECGAMLVATALGNGHTQRRSYPNSFHGNTGGAGWEFVVGLDMEANADRVGREAVQLLSAPMAAPAPRTS